MNSLVNSNVPGYRNLASELHRNYFFKFKLVLSSVRSNTHIHMMAPVRCANRLQTCSVSTPAANMVKLYSFNPLWTMTTAMFQEKPNIYHISEPINRRFFPKLVLLCSLSSSFIDSFSFAMKRCNTWQGFGDFFVQSCDRFLFPFYLFSHFSLSFLIFF